MSDKKTGSEKPQSNQGKTIGLNSKPSDAIAICRNTRGVASQPASRADLRPPPKPPKK